MAKDSETLKTPQVSLDIIEVLSELDKAGVSRIADELDKPPSTIHRHLATLHEKEYVTKDGGIYKLGLRFLKLGKEIKKREHLYELSDGYTKKAAEATGARAIFAVEEHGWGVYVSRNAGEHSTWQHEMVGTRFYLHSTAAGKAILAHMPDEAVDRIADEKGLPQLTEATITNLAELKKELAQVRDQGVGYNREEHVEGVKAVAAPVLNQTSQILGALSVNGPAEQMVGEMYQEELPSKLVGIANEFELDLTLGETSD